MKKKITVEKFQKKLEKTELFTLQIIENKLKLVFSETNYLSVHITDLTEISEDNIVFNIESTRFDLTIWKRDFRFHLVIFE